MPFLDFGVSPESGVKGPYTDYDTALAALRADTGASDGDLYQLDSGDTYVAQSIGSSFGLIPAKWADQISGDMSNASGSALRIAGESKATTLGRGWTETLNNGTITEVGDALRFDSGTGNLDYAQILFTPTTGPAASTGVLVALVIQMVDASTTQRSAYAEVRDGTKKRRIVFDNGGVAGAVAWHNSDTATERGENNASIGTDKSVLFIYFPASGELGAVQVVGDPAALCAVDYADFGTVTPTGIVFLAYNLGGGATKQTIFDIFDIAVWEV